MKRPQPLIGKKDIVKAVDRLAGEIRKDLQGANPLLIGILKGSFVFIADLVRALNMPLEVDFVCLSSYGSAVESSGKPQVRLGTSCSVKGRHLLVVDDIVDTGITLNYLFDYLRRGRPASLRLCALLDKPERRKLPVAIDYIGFTVPNKFIVGYGIDWNERYRYLPDICFVEGGEYGA